MQTDVCMTSGGGTLDSVGYTSPDDLQNGEFQKKLIKEEEPEDEKSFCKTKEHNRVQFGSK